MLTPRFKISQNAESILVSIRAPFAKISEAEIEVVDNELQFYSKPYHLRLYFPGDVAEDGVATEYSATDGIFEIRIAKKDPGAHFADLDMITKLLTPRGTWRVPVLPVEINGDASVDGDVDSIAGADLDWRYPQEMPPENDDGASVSGKTVRRHRYGFGLRRTGVFCELSDELRMILDLENVDDLSPDEITQQREALEADDFCHNDEHYLSNLFDEEELTKIEEICCYQPWWTTLAGNGEQKVDFDGEEVDVLKELPRHEIKVSPDVVPIVWATLAEIIFAYAYDHRTTMGNSTVESSWTVAKLSPSLSCTDHFTSVTAALRACIRRSLCYPLYRNWNLSQTVIRDVKNIVALGRSAILKTLLHVRAAFSSSQENRYILNDLYIIDYCVWIQSIGEGSEDYQLFRNEVAEVRIQKDDVGLDLEITEEAGRLAMEERGAANDETSADLQEQIKKLALLDSDDDED
ncbi:protein SHQ1 homolog [Paramacrobiotus metropolitanus]|uniref:protein SHQ1 homolog n=1 Tax=Paramacrobiotus metropolitanus TaxID=2943436 RepID=UPI0024464285|nr:protein SHQ1 homolog [Paramacrobiotus metropolitanus]